MQHGPKEDPATSLPLEVWGGFECTIARTGDEYRNQIEETGHDSRLADLDLAASLGLSRLRYPVLWEMVAPDHPEARSWEWTDARLHRIRDLRMSVIAGLVHHGSGPRYTSLDDPQFPHLLAGHARAVAERYPWIEDFTPVNEPLTTARFSGLYGHWYPHGHDVATFLRLLFTQCQAIARAMMAIRTVTPGARLIQTEDLGRVFSSPRLAYQAAYENERRWLSFDLLTGRVDRSHPWFQRFVRSGVDERALLDLAEQPCPPQIVGINHYLTSDRYLDEDWHGYPAEHVGGNGRDRYADVAAARAHLPPSELGFERRLEEAWTRYGLPVALTEVHNGSTREEQLRWLIQAWDGANALRARGADVRAFTLWALVGAVDWTSLLTRRLDDYEPGVFDARANPPRPTALAAAVRTLAAASTYDHPVARSPGWWQRPDRYHRQTGLPAVASSRGPPLLITGRTGTLGRALARVCEMRGLPYQLLSRADMDIADPLAVRAVVAHHRPWAIVNAAGFVRVADAAREQSRCMRENTTGAAVLAEAAAAAQVPLVTFSSDLVFSGEASRAYVESDTTCPTCTYGRSKAEAERLVLAGHPGAMVVRTSAFFGPWDRYNFAYHVLAALQRGIRVEVDSRTVVSPTYVPDLVNTALDLLIDGADGVWHVASDGHLSWFEFAFRIARRANLDVDLVREAASSTPRFTALGSEKGVRLRSVDEVLGACVRELIEADFSVDRTSAG